MKRTTVGITLTPFPTVSFYAAFSSSVTLTCTTNTLSTARAFLCSIWTEKKTFYVLSHNNRVQRVVMIFNTEWVIEQAMS